MHGRDSPPRCFDGRCSSGPSCAGLQRLSIGDGNGIVWIEGRSDREINNEESAPAPLKLLRAQSTQFHSCLSFASGLNRFHRPLTHSILPIFFYINNNFKRSICLFSFSSQTPFSFSVSFSWTLTTASSATKRLLVVSVISSPHLFP